MLETEFLHIDTTLRRGSADRERVARVQEWLRFHDFKTSIDGRYGSATEQCVKEFQLTHMLAVSGEVDPATYKALVRPMFDALQAPAPLPPAANISSTALDCARLHLAQGAGEVGGNNRGPWVRLYLRGEQRPVDGPVREASWCAGFVSTTLEQAAATLHRKAPLGYHTDCNKLADEAKKRGLFREGGSIHYDSIPPGTVILVRRTRQHWHHTGIVSATRPTTVETIEGNAPHVSGGRSDSVARETRGYRDLDFILLL
jgi:hypothetical protein